MLGYTGSYNGRPVSVQTTGMGCPSAAIVVEELIGLGAKNLLSVGTCGGYHPRMELGDLVIATAAAPADGTVKSLNRGTPYGPAAHFDLVHAAHHAAETASPDRNRFLGPIVSSDLFYDREEDPQGLWHSLGVLAVEMEAATIFTLAAMRGARAGCLLTVSDAIGRDGVERIEDSALAYAVEDLTRLALETLDALN